MRASAPAGMAQAIKQHQQQLQQQQQHDDDNGVGDEEDAPPSRPQRPGSAARTRQPAADVRSSRDGPPMPQPSQSPTFAGSKGQQGDNGGNNHSQSNKSQRVEPPRQLTEAEMEALEAEAALRREREAHALKEARKVRNAKRAEQAMIHAQAAERERMLLVEQREKKKKKSDKEKNKEKAQLHKLEEYMETLYEEDIDKKIRGTSLILQLVQNPENLDHFIDNDTVLGALARVLAEDRKKSVELSTNILEIFFCFSSFRQLHPILLQNKIGMLTSHSGCSDHTSSSLSRASSCSSFYLSQATRR